MNIGIIGAGSYGAQHAAALAEIDELHLIAANRTNPTALQKFTAQYGGTAYGDYRDLLANDQIDAVVIATPHAAHTQIAVAAAQAGKHILLEKPMAPTLSECDAIIQAAEQAGVMLMVGHVNHFAPAYIQAKEILESGELGQVVLGTSTMSKFWFEDNRRAWHLDRATSGGMLRTAGIHCLDRLTWLVDSPVTSVAAQLGTAFHDQQADDAGLLFLRYANGVAGVVVSVGYAQGAPKHLTELTCTKGMLNIDYQGGVMIGQNEQWQRIPHPGSENWMHEALVNEWRAFAAAITAGTVSPVTGAFARHIMAVVFAAEESTRQQQEITVPSYSG